MDQSNIDSVYWDFGDPGSSQNHSRDFEGKHSFTAPGDYKVSVTEYFDVMAFGPYTETVTIIINDVGEISPVNEQFCRIYPNPGDGNIRIVFYSDMEKIRINVRNSVGQAVQATYDFKDLKEKEEVVLNMSDLPAGIYLIEVLTDDKATVSVKYLLTK
jgi:PKD repeat protein